MDSESKQQKRSLEHPEPVSKHTKNTADFIFNDKSKVSVELSFLKRYPTSLLSKALENSANYLQDEDAYYIDSSRFSVDSLILLMEGKITLDSLPMNEICEIKKAANYFFVNDIRDVKAKIEVTLQLFLSAFMKQNGCSIEDKQRNGENKQTLLINVPVIKLIKEICIRHSDPHYILLYKEYKRQYYKECYPEAYNAYISTHPDIESFSLYCNKIRLHSRRNNANNHQEENIIHHEIIPINIDEEIQNEKITKKLNLYTDSIYEYIPISHEQKLVKKSNETIISKEEFSSYTFSFCDEDGHLNTSHPTISRGRCEPPCIQIDNYLLKLPVFKQLRNCLDFGSYYKLETVSPFFKSLSEGIFDNIQTMALNNFINCSMYPEYIQLFKDIITTHVFPNIKTLKIRICDQHDPEIQLYKEILPLITRNNFPKLSIYTINYSTNFNLLEDHFGIISLLTPTSLIELVDIIYLSNGYKTTIQLNESYVNTMCQVKQYHKFKIQVDFDINNYNELWKKLFDSEVINFNTLTINLSKIDPLIHDYSFDISHCSIKCLNIDINNDSIDKMKDIQNLLQTINTTNLEEIYFHFEHYDTDTFTEFFNALLHILHNKFYNNVTKVDISVKYNSNIGFLNENQMIEMNRILLEFFSLFTDNIRSLYIRDETHNYPDDAEKYPFKMFDNISELINNKKLIHLQSVTMVCDYIFYSHDPETYEYAYPFIQTITNCSLDSLPCLKQFLVDDGSLDKMNLFNVFPSLYFDHHMICNTIKMNYEIIYYYDAFLDYSEYIYKELQKPYTKGITNLYLRIVDNLFLMKFVDLIINDSFPYLNKLTIKIESDTDKIDINDYMPLLNNYKEETNNNLDISIYIPSK
ncbi:hypothetical protein WA158_004114 [Blastocystis sp. Blastoise]